MTDEHNRRVFNLAVKAKLVGKAFDAVKSVADANNWPSIRKALKAKINPISIETAYNMLMKAQQNDNESVMDFANRIESLLVQLNRAATEAAPEEAKEHIRTNHAKLAKRSFEFGLRNPELRTVIISKNCSTITQTIKEAVELASYEPFSRSNTQSDSRRGTKYCSHCRKNNHNSNECFRTKNTVKTKPENNESDEGSKFCKYCKKKGHVISECRKRQRNNQQRAETYSKNTRKVATDPEKNL